MKDQKQRRGNNQVLPDAAGTAGAYLKATNKSEPYEIEFLGKKLVVYPEVFSPKYFSDGKYFARIVPSLVKNRTFCEIGTGTGIVALFCALGKAKKVVATDINPQAVLNAKANAKLNNIKIDVREGNLFEPLGENEKFDIIFWNHPWHPIDPPEADRPLFLAIFDKDHRVVKRFIREASRHLNPGGKVLLGTAAFARIGDLVDFAKKQKYSIRTLKRNQIILDRSVDGKLLTTDYALLEFVLR